MKRTLRRIVTALTAVLFVVLLLGVPSAVAQADVGPFDTDCKTAPAPLSPEGFPYPGQISPKPKHPEKLGDPFAPNSTTPLYEAYSWSAVGGWSTYDLGCGSSTVRNPEAVMSNEFANFMGECAVWTSAVSAGLVYYAFNPGDWINFFDPLVQGVTTTLSHNLFITIGTLMLFAVVTTILWQSHSANMAGVFKTVGWILIVIVASLVLFNFPVQSAKAGDQVVMTMQSQVYSVAQGKGQGTDAQSSAMGAVYENVFYRQWLSGELGAPDSKMANKYGADLFRASNYSWKEWDRIQHDDKYGDKLDKQKADLWDSTAAKIKKEDPSAYRVLTGKGRDRVGAGFAMVVGALTTLPFLVCSALAVIMSLLMLRGMIMLAPLVLSLAILPQFSGMAKGVLRTVIASIINTVAFSMISAIYLVAIRILYNGHLPVLLSSVLLGALGFALWRLTRPFRRIHSMAAINRVRENPVRFIDLETRDQREAIQAWVDERATGAKEYASSRYERLRLGTSPDTLDDDGEDVLDTAGETPPRPEPVVPPKPTYPEADPRLDERGSQRYRVAPEPGAEPDPEPDNRGYALGSGAHPNPAGALPGPDPAAAEASVTATWPSGYGPAAAPATSTAPASTSTWGPAPTDTGARPSEWGRAGDSTMEEEVATPATVLVTEADGTVREVNAVWTSDGPRFDVGSEQR